MTKPLIFVCALLGASAIAQTALASCLLCRCVYSGSPNWPPTGVSSSFSANNLPECLAKCNDIRIQCPFPGACYSVVARYEVLGRVPDDLCPNPPPYARGGVRITILPRRR
jgi:hypothetical protein